MIANRPAAESPVAASWVGEAEGVDGLVDVPPGVGVGEGSALGEAMSDGLELGVGVG
jgi:hypothetical protein